MEREGTVSGKDAQRNPHDEGRFDKPDWATLHEEIECPLCAYNLRGLIDPRCPECGCQFHWRDLLDPNRRRHPYLFEDDQDMGFIAFWKTAWHGLWPASFWTTLRVDQTCHVERLFGYWALVMVFFVASVVSEFVIEMVNYRARFWVSSIRWFINWTTGSWTAVMPAVAVLAWPWLTASTLLLIFRASNRHAKVRVFYILRCVVYSSDIVLWASLIAFLANMTAAVLSIRSARTTAVWELAISLGVWPIVAGVFCYRMIVAYQKYLRFKHAVATILATQLIVVLLSMTIMALFFVVGISLRSIR